MGQGGCFRTRRGRLTGGIIPVLYQNFSGHLRDMNQNNISWGILQGLYLYRKVLKSPISYDMITLFEGFLSVIKVPVLFFLF